MKVLKKGRPQKGWSMEFFCTGNGNGMGGCGAKLLVEQKDLFETQSQARDETTYYRTFICSECRVPTDIPERVSLPFDLRAPTKDEEAIVYGRSR